MKISHKELSICQQSPKSWVAARVQQEKNGSGARFGYNQALSYSISELHKTADIQKAREKLDGYLTRFLDKKKKETIRERLTEYAVWLDQSATVVIDSNVTLDYPTKGDWHLGGLVSRIDLLPEGGYRAVLFEPIVPDWKQQLRMPLIQLAIADRYGRPAKEIRVGFHDLDGNETDDHRYGETSRDNARAAFEELGNKVFKLLPPPSK